MEGFIDIKDLNKINGGAVRIQKDALIVYGVRPPSSKTVALA
ncbi:hypothetical protein [Clostridium cellulovorans]|uniref:Uncharacterized protein n=1 Tax=Clostridium cellulovorans (strain ATCC 35296 / DSM 3052 / OCM 3 / 743B) TaxID=573061 RepID=D9SMC8_CLOC7|nr:hypothetical protein [Clostridium cellulovorans]ADL53784.1 hypothetical protein Clocel_4123 [Clostridium cellulovorans 743B]